MLELSGINGGVTVRLRNAKGTLLATADVSQGIVNCNGLLAGLYIVEVVQDQRTVNVFTAMKF